MKQKIYIFGLITTFLIFAGIVLKINHLAGAGKTMTIGFGTMVILFLPIALRNNFKSEGTRQNLLLYIVTWITCFVVFTAALFKIMHWPFAGTLITIALPFPYIVFLPVFLAVTAKNKNFSIYNTVFVLMLLVINSVFSGLLSLNVTRNRIDDSFNLSGNYFKVETILDKFPEQIPDNQVIQRLNEVLSTVDSYQEIIMKQENISPEQWKNNPQTIHNPDTKGLAARALINSGENPEGTKLLSGLKNLVKSLEITPGYAELAKKTPQIFDILSPTGNEADWYSWKFKDNNLAWVLIYLDGLETNLKMIRATVATAGK
jgi:hypothetical protein